MTDELRKIYYQPEHLWTGRKVTTMLREATKLPLKQVEAWLAKQALWQVHVPPPKRIDHLHYYVTEVNEIHQADLLYLSHDKVYQTVYKYTLQVVDVASRYKVSRPLKTKKLVKSQRCSRTSTEKDLCDTPRSFTWTTVASSRPTFKS